MSNRIAWRVRLYMREGRLAPRSPPGLDAAPSAPEGL